MTILEKTLIFSNILLFIFWLWNSLLLNKQHKFLITVLNLNSSFQELNDRLGKINSKLIDRLKTHYELISSNNDRITAMAERIDTNSERLDNRLKEFGNYLRSKK